jgi:hypothetical protein
MTGDFSLETIVIVTVGVLILVWLVLVLLSRVQYRRTMALPLFGPEVISAVAYTSTEAASHAASDRREHLERFLREYGSEGVVRREFIETPAGFDNVRVNEFEGDRRSAASHTAHLYWQLSDDRLLLLERVIDSIVCLQRIRAEEDTDFLITARLAAVPERAGTSLYPWRIIIETSNPVRLSEHLRPLAEWLGIGVDFAPQTLTHNLGACTVGDDGSSGQAAGILESQVLTGQEYGLVCHHVLSQGCGSLCWPTPPNRPQYANYSTQGVLDAALIHLGAPCFVKANARRIDIRCASSSDRERFIDEALEVEKWPVLDGRQGVIEQPAPAIRTLRGQIRAPHIQVIPKFTKRFGVMWPLFHRAFSSQGDSGAWVTDKARILWFGMVVHGADPPVARTYALEASFLLDAISRALPSEAPFNPKRLG